MSIKLLPASVNAVDSSQTSAVSTSLVPLTPRAITRRAGQIALVPSPDAFAWSSSSRRGATNRIYGTIVEDFTSDQTGVSDSEYVSGWFWSASHARTALDHYLFYAANPTIWRGRSVDLYA